MDSECSLWTFPNISLHCSKHRYLWCYGCCIKALEHTVGLFSWTLSHSVSHLGTCHESVVVAKLELWERPKLHLYAVKWSGFFFKGEGLGSQNMLDNSVVNWPRSHKNQVTWLRPKPRFWNLLSPFILCGWMFYIPCVWLVPEDGIGSPHRDSRSLFCDLFGSWLLSWCPASQYWLPRPCSRGLRSNATRKTRD